ncbi:MAG: hypothetical protein BMS9Abin26_1194 [Gammaproteobacteria bacterium]|nr:MAG: hypothetical protein BMS9Abin26_1194 [Gammaproteobacteria bacterium]
MVLSRGRSFVGALITIFCAALFLSYGAEARDVYVSKTTGANSNPGTKEKPLKLLWKAINKLARGDRIHVAAGTYAGKRKVGLMPGLKGARDVVIEGGWNTDFSERDPFKYLTIIGSKPKSQPPTGVVFHFEDADKITIDGFLIDRGIANYYYSDGEPGANKSVAGHIRDSAFGYRAINRKKSGSDPTIMLFGKGSFTIRNMILMNNPWWGIYVKGGGKGVITIENNLILITQGRGIEAITGGGWGSPTWVIRNNTVAFGHTLKTTEGRALSIDPRKGKGKYIIENNVFAFNDGSGVSAKFGARKDTLTMNNNKFFFNRRADFGQGGQGVANVDEFEDELEVPNAGNLHELPKFLVKSSKAWFDRYSSREFTNMLAGQFNSWENLAAARAVFELKEYQIPGYDKTYATYADLPQKRNNYDMSRYPHPMKLGEVVDWQSDVLQIIGADGKQGIQAYKKSPK